VTVGDSEVRERKSANFSAPQYKRYAM